MPYIGNQPSESFTSFATQEFSTSATTSYTLDHAVTNENEIALFINNVRQQPGSGKAYTATGTALTLSAATASTDTMYCVFLGRALQTVTPATNSITAAMVGNNAVTGAKLNTDVISAQTALGATPADTDEFLVSDAGVLKRVDYSYIKGGGGTALVSTSDVTSYTSNIVVDGIFSSSYRNYLIIGNLHTESNDQQIELRYRQSSSTVTSSSYRRGWNGNYSTNSSGSSRYDSGSYGGSSISLINNISSTENTGGSYFNMYLYEPLGTDNFKTVTFHSSSESPNNTKSFMNLSGNGLFYGNTTALSGLDFFAQSGNIKGNIKIYGLT